MQRSAFDWTVCAFKLLTAQQQRGAGQPVISTNFAMEDTIDLILQDSGTFSTERPHVTVSVCSGALFAGLYGVWSLFALPGFRKVPWSLKHCAPKCSSNKCGRGTKRVPYLPSSKDQTLNIMKLLKGRRGRLADLGSGDGRLVFAACSAGFQCTGFEINSILVAYARSKAYWVGVPSSQATFVKKDFWKTDLSSYNNVTAFLAPGVMEALEKKLLKELPDDARVITCRFPFPNWPQKSSAGSGLNQTFAYDIRTVRSHLTNAPSR